MEALALHNRKGLISLTIMLRMLSVSPAAKWKQKVAYTYSVTPMEREATIPGGEFKQCDAFHTNRHIYVINVIDYVYALFQPY